MLVVSTETVYKYSVLSTDPKPTTDIRNGSLLWETDTNKKYEWRETAWFEVIDKVSIDNFPASINASVSEDNYTVVLYQDGDLIYVCKAVIGSVLTAAVWQIRRLDVSSGVVMKWCDGNDNFDNVATSLSVVAALNFS